MGKDNTNTKNGVWIGIFLSFIFGAYVSDGVHSHWIWAGFLGPVVGIFCGSLSYCITWPLGIQISSQVRKIAERMREARATQQEENEANEANRRIENARQAKLKKETSDLLIRKLSTVNQYISHLHDLKDGDAEAYATAKRRIRQNVAMELSPLLGGSDETRNIQSKLIKSNEAIQMHLNSMQEGLERHAIYDTNATFLFSVLQKR